MVRLEIELKRGCRIRRCTGVRNIGQCVWNLLQRLPEGRQTTTGLAFFRLEVESSQVECSMPMAQ